MIFIWPEKRWQCWHWWGVELVSSDQFFCFILRQGGCNIQSEGKANQRWDVDASKLSLLGLVSRDVFLDKMSLDVKDFTNWHFESLKWVVSRIWVGRLFDTWAVRVGPFHGIIVAQNRDPYLLFWYAHRSWTEFFHVQGRCRQSYWCFEKCHPCP